MKKRASNVAHNQPAQTTAQSRIIFPFYEISGPDICSLICGSWLSVPTLVPTALPSLVSRRFCHLLLRIFSYLLSGSTQLIMLTDKCVTINITVRCATMG